MRQDLDRGRLVRWRKLHPRHLPLVFAFIMSATFAFIMSGVLTAFNLGLVPGFLGLWMRNYAVAWVVAFPTALVVVPIVRRLVAMVVATPSDQGRPGPSEAVG